MPKALLKQARNQNAVEAAILDRDGTHNCRGPLRAHRVSQRSGETLERTSPSQGPEKLYKQGAPSSQLCRGEGYHPGHTYSLHIYSNFMGSPPKSAKKRTTFHWHFWPGPGPEDHGKWPLSQTQKFMIGPLSALALI